MRLDCHLSAALVFFFLKAKREMIGAASQKRAAYSFVDVHATAVSRDLSAAPALYPLEKLYFTNYLLLWSLCAGSNDCECDSVPSVLGLCLKLCRKME